jgi:pimeloyl-ACP methyl ester carboxylesterase
VNSNRACGNSKRRFLRSLTTVNMARDLDAIRRALGESELSYLGATWGTWLGAVYRSLFPAHVSRMWLESVANPQPGLDLLEADRAEATATDFSRPAAWTAARDDTYRFGSTGEQVEAALAQLRQSYDANPRTFTDLDRPIDGSLIAELAASPTRVGWSTVAEALAELRDATGPTAPPTVKAYLTGSGRGDERPPTGVPEGNNPTLAQAVVCNEDTGLRDFASAWAAYQQRLQLYPTTGRHSGYVPSCAGWPLPVQRVALRHTAGSLVLSGHRYETDSPYTSTRAMQAAIGGTVFTVEDDVSESGLHVPGCVRHIVAYFKTGDPHGDGCPGYQGAGKPPPQLRISAAQLRLRGPARR